MGSVSSVAVPRRVADWYFVVNSSETTWKFATAEMQTFGFALRQSSLKPFVAEWK